MVIKSDTSLKEEIGYKRFIPEYIFVLEPNLVKRFVETFDSHFYKCESFTIVYDVKPERKQGYTRTRRRRIFMVTLNTKVRHSSGSLNGLKILPQEILYSPETVIGIRGGKYPIVYLKDKWGVNMTKKHALDIFRADLHNWLKYSLALINT